MPDLELFQLMGMSSAILWYAAISSALQLCMDLAQSKLAHSSMRDYEWRPSILFGKADPQRVCMIIITPYPALQNIIVTYYETKKRLFTFYLSLSLFVGHIYWEKRGSPIATLQPEAMWQHSAETISLSPSCETNTGKTLAFRSM